MSSTITDDGVEETKRQIRTLVNEIAELSKAGTSPNEYYPAVLQRIIAALAAQGGAVWLVENNTLRMAYKILTQPEGITDASENANRHARLLGHVMQQNQPELVPPNSEFGEKNELSNPTPFLLVLAPLVTGTQAVGIIEVFQRPDTQFEAQRGYLRFIEHISKLIADWLKAHAFQAVTSRQAMWQQADEFARLVHNSLDIRDTAFTIANEGRRLIECDRVSVATMRGRKARVIAMSGQDSIENRSNEVQALNKLATRVVRSGESLWYDGATEELPPQIETAIEDYVDLSHGRTVSVLPIFQPEQTIAGDVLSEREAIDSRGRARKIIGALIVEQIETQLARNELEGRVDLVYEHACRAIANSQTHSSIFLMPLWRLLDRLTWLFRGSAFPKTMLALFVAALVTAALCLIKIDFDLEAKGKLVPRQQRNIFAHVDGEVKEVYVSHGDKVKADQPVVLLKNPELEVRLEDLRGQYQQALGQQRSIEYSQNIAGLPAAEKRRLDAELAENRQQQQSLKAQYQILQSRAQQLVRTSPIDGTVTTWEVEKTLRSRPVVTGQVLLNVADFDQEWDLEVMMPEKRMKHLDQAFASTNQDYLVCDFILRSDPSATNYTGKLYRTGVHQQTELNGDEGTTVKLRIVPDSMVGIKPLPNAEVTVDVKCGKAAAGYAWFHEIPEWIRANVIF